MRFRYDRRHFRQEHRPNQKEKIEWASEAIEINGPKDRQREAWVVIKHNLCIFICGCKGQIGYLPIIITKIFSRIERNVEIKINSNKNNNTYQMLRFLNRNILRSFSSAGKGPIIGIDLGTTNSCVAIM